MSGPRGTLLAVAAGVALTMLFWWPLWTGGGLVGGDVYSYFLPQKVFLGERLVAGELPLWNSWTGFGYPLVGESQTAVLYPPNLVLYGLLPAGTAYSVGQLLHYVLAFVFTWLFARRFGLEAVPAAFTALVFVYGWFPPRNCLEWAIVTGCWLPAVLWCVESFLQTGRRRYLVGTSACLALQLLAGHFNLAFITVVVAGLWTLLRVGPRIITQDDEGPGWGRGSVTCLALLLGFGLAGVQLAPTWALKSESQRRNADRSESFDVGMGFIPPIYLTQVVAPWAWYDGDTDAKLQVARGDAVSNTNKVEAHLYFGLVPLALVLWGFVAPRFGFDGCERRRLLWLIPGGLALVYACGWPVPFARSLPGFGFFTGPGRWGIVTTLAVALLAGGALQSLLKGLGRSWAIAIAVAVFGATIVDLSVVASLVRYSVIVEHPPLGFRDESAVRLVLLESPESPRLLAPGQNLPSLLGVSALPVYLGLGPREYFENVPELPDLSTPGEYGLVHATPEQVDWLRRAGVTHVLVFGPLDPTEWPAKLVWSGTDEFLHRAWGRPASLPLYLYTLEEPLGRVALVASNRSASIVELQANRVVVDVDAPQADRLVLRELAATGWQVTIDGEPAEPVTVDGWFRGVDVPAGRHTVVWRYRPTSLYWGAAISGMSFLLIVGSAFRWRRVSKTDPSSVHAESTN